MSFDVAPVAPTFPAQFLDVRTELQLSGGWTDVSSYVYHDTLTITRGHPDESTTTAPSSLAAQFNNADGRFAPHNATGPYYGQFGLNTPVRVSIPWGASYLRLEGDSSSYAQASIASMSTNFGSANGLDVQIDVTPDNWYTSQVLISAYQNSTNSRCFMLAVSNTGVPTLVLGGTTGINGTSFYAVQCPTALTVAPRARLSLRATYIPATGAVTFYTGTQLGGWTVLATTTASVNADVFWNNPPVQIGGCADMADFATWASPGFATPYTGFNGMVHAALVQNTNATPTVLLQADFTQLAQGQASYTDLKGNVWTPQGTAEISTRFYRFHGEVAEWPQKWKPGSANAILNLAAGGLLRRSGQGQLTVQSPMYRFWTKRTGALAPFAYWPCEDGSSSTQIASGIGGPAMTFGLGKPSLSSSSAFASSQSLVVLNSAQLIGNVPAYNAGTNGGDAVVVRFLCAVPSGGDTSGAILARVNVGTGQGTSRMDLVYTTASGGSLTLAGYDANAAQLWTSGAQSFGGVNGKLLEVSIELQYAGGPPNYVAALAVLPVGASSAAGTTWSSATQNGTVGSVTQVIFNAPGLLLAQTAIGHVAVQNTWQLVDNMAGAIAAYQSEPAGVRFQRLCGEEGIQFRGVGNMSDTVPMGVQTEQTVVALLQECVDADYGIWFEPRQCVGWGYRTRASLGNQTSAIALDYNQDHLSEDLNPTFDDQTVKNDITVTNNASGSSSRQVQTTGPMSVNMAPNGVGRYDTSVTVNVAADNMLDSVAGWRLYMGTVNQPRYPSIGIDMANAAMAALWYQVLSADLGDRLTIANPPIWLPPGLVDQLLQGVTEQVGDKVLDLAWNGIPSLPWNVAYADDVVYGRADTDGSTLSAGVSAGTVPQQWSGGGGWTGWAASYGNVATSSKGLTVTADGTGTSFWQGYSPSYACSAGQTVAVTATVTANTALGKLQLGIHLGGGSDTFQASTAIAVAAGQTVTLHFSATAATGQNSWNVYVVDSEASPSGSSFIVNSISAGIAGTLPVATTNSGSPLWTTNSADFPFDISVGGERITVTGISGTSSPQTFTVLRSVNGVVKAQAAGTDVRLFTAPIISL